MKPESVLNLGNRLNKEFSLQLSIVITHALVLLQCMVVKKKVAILIFLPYPIRLVSCGRVLLTNQVNNL